MKTISMPETSETLAEYIGIHYGDGNLMIDKNYSYRITISLNLLKDKDFSQYVRYLCAKLFDLRMTISDNPEKNQRLLRTYSKALLFYLNERWDAPIGEKRNLIVPLAILRNRVYLLSFVRGLFDSDGCIFIRATNGYRYPVIKISNRSEEFLSQISIHLNLHGFRSYVSESSPGYELVLNGWKQKSLWAGMIGSSNSRNMKKLYGARGI